MPTRKKSGATYHKPYKGKYGTPVKSASGKTIKPKKKVSGTLKQKAARRTAMKSIGAKRRS